MTSIDPGQAPDREEDTPPWMIRRREQGLSINERMHAQAQREWRAAAGEASAAASAEDELETINDRMYAQAQAQHQREAANRNLLLPPVETPDQTASTIRDRTTLGAPVPMDPLTRSAAQAARSRRALEDSPRLHVWLADVTNAAVARDDVVALSFWERLSAAYQQGERNIELARLSNRDNPVTWRNTYDAGPLDEAGRRRLEQLRHTRQFRSTNWLEDTATQLPQLFGSVDAALRRSVRGASDALHDVYGDKPLQLGDVGYAALLSPIALVGSTLAGAGGLAEGYLGFTYEQEAGAAFEEFRFLRDANGNQIDPMVAARAAQYVGGINMALELLGVGFAAKALNVAGAGEIVERITSVGVRSALRQIGYRQVVQRAAVGVIGTGLEEGFTELGQEGVTVFYGEIARGMSAPDALAHMTDADVAGRLWEAFRVGATVGAVFGAAPTTVTTGLDLMDVHRTRTQAVLLDAMTEGADASKLRTRSPSSFMSAVQTMVKDGPIETMRIQARRFAEAFDQHDEDAFAAADKLNGVGAQQLRDALETGGDVEIPMATWAAQIHGTEAAKRLGIHTRVGPEQLSIAEVRARIELGIDLGKAATEGARLQQEAEASATNQTKTAEAVKTIFDRFHDIMRASKTFANAAVIDKDVSAVLAMGIVAQAEAGGVAPEELFKDLGIEVTGPFGEQAPAAEHAYDQDGAPKADEAAVGEAAPQVDEVAAAVDSAAAAVDSAAAAPVQLEQGDKKKGAGPAGQIVFGRDENGFVNRAQVFFFETRNASTPIHELMGHLFLESLRLVASKETATEQAKADWATILQWFGVSNEQWTTMSKLPPAEAVAALKPYHEKFARGVEVYFKEGKAPSLELRDIMARFKNWMMWVYQKTGGKVPGAPVLDDEIREVFDRMLATQEQIKRAKDANGTVAPMGRDLFQAGERGDKQYAKYIEQWQRGRDAAQAAMDSEIVTAIYSEFNREWRRVAARARRTVIAEMKEDPLWVAHDWLIGLNIPPGQNALQLNSAESIAEFGAELVDALPKGIVTSDVDQLVTQAQWAAQTLKGPAPLRLFQRLDQLQVLDPDGSLTGTPRATGMSLNTAAEQLWDEGFFGPKPHAFMQNNDEAKPMSEAEHALSILPLLTGEEAVEPVGGITEIATYLENRSRERIRAMGIESGVLDLENPEHRDIVARIVAHEAHAHMQGETHAGEWYDETIKLLMQLAAIRHPELETEPHARMAFTAAIAIASQKQNVVDNLSFALKQYAAYMASGNSFETRRFTVTGTGKAQKPMTANFAKMNEMLTAWGPESFRLFLATQFSVSEMAAAGLGATGMPVDYAVTGSYVLGPKIGWGFFSNLNGNFEPVTVDMWLMRTIGRLMGKVRAFDEKVLEKQVGEFVAEARARVAKKNREPGIYADQIEGFDRSRLGDRDYVLQFAEDVRRAHESDFNSMTPAEYEDTRVKTKLVRSAERIHTGLRAAKDSPKSGAERVAIAQIIEQAVAKFAALSGRRAPPASLQAIVWYPEQELYKALGAKLRETSVDYAAAMRRLLTAEGIDVDEKLRARQLRERPGAGADGRRADRAVPGAADAGSVGQPQAADAGEAGFSPSQRAAFLRSRAIRTVRRAYSGDDARESRPYGRGSDRGLRRLQLTVPEAIALWEPKKPFANRAEKVASTAPNFIELDPAAGAGRFHAAIMASKANNKHSGAVYVYDVDSYREMRLFVSEDGAAGFALKPDGDIVSVFKNPRIAGLPSATFGAMQLAVQEGGRKLDAFDTALPALYSPHGFVVVKRMAWDENQKPADWNYEAFEGFNNGRPDIVFMVYDPRWYGNAEHHPASYTTDYDAAVAAQTAALKRIAKGKPATVHLPDEHWGDTAFFQDEEDVAEDVSPQVDELLDRLKDDIGGRPVYRFGEEEEAANYNEAARVRDWLSDHGIDVNAKKADLHTAIKKVSAKLDERGLSADTIATTINAHFEKQVFDSGHEMLKRLAAMKRRHVYINDEVEARTRAELGDPMDANLAERARVATHNRSAEQTMEMELDAMSRATGGAVRPVSRVAKQIADGRIGLMSVKQVRKFDWFLGNERRHAATAMTALARGNTAEAQSAKYHQLINYHLYVLARKAAAEVESTLAYFKRVQKNPSRIAIGSEYMDQIDQLLEQYELRNISAAEQQGRLSMTAWVRSMEERGLGHMVQIDPVILERAGRIPFTQLNVNDVRSLRDAVKNIEHIGRRKERLLAEAEERSLQKIIAANVAQLRATGAISERQRAAYSPTAFEKVTDGMREAHAQMTRMEFLFRYLDGQHNGPLWRSLWLPFAKAADKESAMQRQFARKQIVIWDAYTPAERARLLKTRFDVAGLPIKGPTGTAISYTRGELLSIALNLGNAGNVQALVDGFGWGKAPEGVDTNYAAAKQMIIDQLDAVLTARDWKAVQQIWDLVATHRDEAFQLQEDMTGLRPEAVKPEAVASRHGELQGGYYPLKFDGQRDVRVSKTDAKQEVQALYGSNWTAPMTRHGHLTERVGSGGRPVKLSLAVYTEHLSNVVHDIAYRRAIVDANRIVSSKAFSDAFIDVAGRAMYDQLPLWLQEIASDKVDPSSFMWMYLQKMRGNAAMAAMGYKLSTALQQLTGVLNAVPMVGGPEMTVALAKLFSRPDLLWQKGKFIIDRSEFMRTRVQTYDRDAREAIERMERNDPLHPIRKNAFMLVGMFDWAVSSVCWTAAYDKARAGNVKGISPDDEQAAVDHADSIVRQTQSAGLAQDLPRIMRGNQVNKLLTMFFSFFSVLYNWTAYDQIMNLQKGRLPPHVFIGNMVLVFVIAPLIAEALAGRWEPRDDETDEERNRRLMMTLVKYPFQTVPVMRDMANAYNSYFDYQLSPAQSVPAAIVNATEDAFALRTFESEASTKRAVLAAGYAFGMPTPQAWIMGDYVVDKLEGEEEGFDPWEAFVADRR